MKKFISMVMAAAMVVTMVPATAFAAGTVTATAEVIDVQEWTEATVGNGVIGTGKAPELQLEVTKASYKDTNPGTIETKITVTLDGAEWRDGAGATLTDADVDTTLDPSVHDLFVEVLDKDGADAGITVTEIYVEDTDELTFTLQGELAKGDVISINLASQMTKLKEGHKAYVSVDSDIVDAEDMVYAAIVGKTLSASVRKTVDVAVEELTTVNDIKIKAGVGDLPSTLTLKLNKGFEFVKSNVTTLGYTWVDSDEIEVDGAGTEIKVEDLQVEATTADEGDVAVIKVSAKGWESASVEVATVCEYKVVMSVDTDEDVPVYYSGVDAANTGLTVTDEHISLEVTIEETFAGAWSHHKDFTLSLPEGVYVVGSGVAIEDNSMEGSPNLVQAFRDAYQEGDHTEFVFEKRTFEETDPDSDSAQGMTFTLELVADPGFVGDVVLKLEGAALDTQEVTIAKFVAPFTVKAEQNDVIIDYRYTEIPTAIVVTEAEAGLWAEGVNAATFTFSIDDAETDLIVFEEDADYTVNEASEMEIKDTTADGVLSFKVTEESDEEAAEVTIDGIKLFMQRNIPAGAYELSIGTSMGAAYLAQPIFAPDVHNGQQLKAHVSSECDEVCFIDDIADFSKTVKEAFLNVVTAGREQSDSSFTTEVVVPVGETTIYAGDKAITLDVPAYINANGYIMVPVRAVANALGIANDCVQWNQASKTVIIMYGDRLITMTAGSSVIYVGGTPLPSTSSVEIVDGRAFLGLRDLANALGVKSIAWDPATKVGTLNPKA